MVPADGPNDAGGELPVIQEFGPGFGVIESERGPFQLAEFLAGMAGLIDDLPVFGRGGLAEEHLADIVEEAGGEGDFARKADGRGKVLGGESGGKGMIPEVGARGAVSDFRAGEDRRSHDGKEDAVNLAKAEAQDGVAKSFHALDAGMEGAVTDFEDIAGEAGIDADELDQILDAAPGIIEEEKQGRKNLKGRREERCLAEVLFNVLHWTQKIADPTMPQRGPHQQRREINEERSGHSALTGKARKAIFFRAKDRQKLFPFRH